MTLEDLYINTDEKYLKQLLINLINNSLYSLTIQSKGYTAINFKLNSSNKEIIDVCILDSGPGIDKEKYEETKVILENMNAMILSKNSNLKELKVGLALSEKIVGKLGPYQYIKIDGNVVKFQIFKDY